VERLKVLRHLGVAALLCVALSGCAKMSNLLDGDSNTSTSAATVTTDSQGNALSPEMIAANQTDPVATLYNRGLADLQSGSYNAAAKNFSEVERQYPYSKWATKAIVMQAYAFYQRNSYDDSINAANRYITLHPAGKDAPYAYYLVALSNYEQIKDVQRDQSRTRKALESLEEVQRRFPESPYAVDAGQRAQLARDHLAAKEMDVGRYYLKNGSYLAGINRFKTVVTNYQTTAQVPEALYRLAEGYMALGVTSEAQTAAAVLGHNFPNSQWYKDAYTLVSSDGQAPLENQESWISRAFRSLNPLEPL
jgi:outer membrane protein assembly factor BamD